MGSKNPWAHWVQILFGGRCPRRNHADKFGDDRFRGFGLADGQSLPFPIYFEGRPYNTHTIVWSVTTYVMIRVNKTHPLPHGKRVTITEFQHNTKISTSYTPFTRKSKHEANVCSKFASSLLLVGAYMLDVSLMLAWCLFHRVNGVLVYLRRKKCIYIYIYNDVKILTHGLWPKNLISSGEIWDPV